MKRHFLAGLMAFCVCAMSLSTVSCGKLEQNINSLQTQVDALSKKLADLETKLNDEVKNLTDAINAVKNQVAVINVEKKDGAVVLTLADGSKINVAEPDANANNEGLVTTVKEGDKTYWAVVKEDGTVENLGVEVGQKLLFQVDPETYELLVSYDGTEYESTGVLVKDTDTINLVTGFEEGEDYVTFTINGQAYTLPKYSDAVLQIKAGKTYFDAGETKTVEVLVDGVESFVVMAKPEGWRANLAGKKLNVTAPAQTLLDSGIAEEGGLIILHGETSNGACKMVSLSVSTGTGLILEVDKNGNITVTNPFGGEQTNMWGETSFAFTQYAFGLAPIDYFEADPKGYIENFNDYSLPWEGHYNGYLYNLGDFGEHQYSYVPGENEVDVINTTVAEVYKLFTYEEMPLGSQFIVWAAPMNDMGAAIADELVFGYYAPVIATADLVEKTHNDIKVKINTLGADSFIIGKMAESSYSSEWNPMTFEQYMQSPMGGPWTSFTQYGMPDALGMPYQVMTDQEFWLSDLVMYEGEDPAKLSYGETYKLWIFPVKNGKEPAEYSFEEDFMPYVYTFETNDIMPGGEYVAEFGTPVADYSSVAVTITPAEGAEATFYYFYSEEDYEYFAGDEDAIREDLFYNCYSPLAEEGEVKKTYCQPGDKFILAVVSVGTDGKYSAVQELPCEVLGMPYDEAITITAESVTVNADGNYDVVFAVTGADYVMGYDMGNANAVANAEKNVLSYGVAKSGYGCYFADVVDGKATVTFTKNSYKTYFYGVAYNIANGIVSGISAETFVAPFADYITE